jgi:hypothetical protein
MEIRREGYHAPAIIFFADIPTMMDFLFLLGILISLVGVVFVYWQMVIKGSSSKRGWWIQGVGFLILVVAYLIKMNDFMNSAGSFG